MVRFFDLPQHVRERIYQELYEACCVTAVIDDPAAPRYELPAASLLSPPGKGKDQDQEQGQDQEQEQKQGPLMYLTAPITTHLGLMLSCRLAFVEFRAATQVTSKWEVVVYIARVSQPAVVTVSWLRPADVRRELDIAELKPSGDLNLPDQRSPENNANDVMGSSVSLNPAAPVSRSAMTPLTTGPDDSLQIERPGSLPNKSTNTSDNTKTTQMASGSGQDNGTELSCLCRAVKTMIHLEAAVLFPPQTRENRSLCRPLERLSECITTVTMLLHLLVHKGPNLAASRNLPARVFVDHLRLHPLESDVVYPRQGSIYPLKYFFKSMYMYVNDCYLSSPFRKYFASFSIYRYTIKSEQIPDSFSEKIPNFQNWWSDVSATPNNWIDTRHWNTLSVPISLTDLDEERQESREHLVHEPKVPFKDRWQHMKRWGYCLW